jgi:uncharacterized membrane protein YqgA involved in biofilm formation
MNLTILLLIFCCLAVVIGSIMTIRKSANKFILSDEQKKKIKQREIEQQQKDKRQK